MTTSKGWSAKAVARPAAPPLIAATPFSSSTRRADSCMILLVFTSPRVLFASRPLRSPLPASAAERTARPLRRDASPVTRTQPLEPCQQACVARRCGPRKEGLHQSLRFSQVSPWRPQRGCCSWPQLQLLPPARRISRESPSRRQVRAPSREAGLLFPVAPRRPLLSVLLFFIFLTHYRYTRARASLSSRDGADPVRVCITSYPVRRRGRGRVQLL